jgi:periplasmic protein CpxP/Spy
MNTDISTPPTRPAPRRSLLKRATFIAFIAGGALAAGVAALASGSDFGGCHRGMMLGGTHSAADVSAHVDHVLKHLYVEIDATDAQKAQIEPLVKQAVDDLLPLQTQIQTAHAQAIAGLTQATIDRAALENARAAHLQLVDQASTRLTRLLADVGDVLTPAQRVGLAAHVKKMHGLMGG